MYSERHTTPKDTQNLGNINNFEQISYSSTKKMPQVNDESQVISALSAIEKDPKLSVRAAAALFGVRHEKLSRRKRGLQSRRKIWPTDFFPGATSRTSGLAGPNALSLAN